MMDDIGLGQALANMLYLFILFIAIAGAGAFLMIKKKSLAFWWVSVSANVFSFLFFLGDSTLIGWLIRIFSMVGWPVINLFWLGMIVFAPKNK